MNKSHLIPEIRLLKRCKTANLSRISKPTLGADLRRDSDSPSYIVCVTGFQVKDAIMFNTVLYLNLFKSHLKMRLKALIVIYIQIHNNVIFSATCGKRFDARKEQILKVF